MKRKNWSHLKDLAYYSSLGFQIALSIFIGLGFGIYGDRWFGTQPWLTLIGLLFGILAGFRNIGLAIRKTRKF